LCYMVSDKMAQNLSIRVNVYLKGEIADQFLAIKQKKALENNTDLLRLIIREYYEKEVTA